MTVPVPPKFNSGVTTLMPVTESTFPSQDVMTNRGHKLKIEGASLEDIHVVESMIVGCATDGDGFCLDEFSPDDGHFLHKFIHEPRVLVATDSYGTITVSYTHLTLPTKRIV